MVHQTMRVIAAGLIAAGMAVAAGSAQAQDEYPSRAIEIVSGFGTGGTSDLVARMTAKYLGDKWGVPINVVNKPGGNTVPAQVEIYSAPPDGYHLYSDNIGSTSMLATSVPNLPFDVAERTFISMITSNSMLMYVGADSPYQTLQGVVEEAKRDPENFTWTGVGVAEIPVRQLFRAAGVDITKTKPIVSTGTTNAVVLAAGGNVKLAVGGVGPSISPAQSGLIRPLALAAEQRLDLLPDVPTAAEAGFPNVKVISWIGLSGPPGLPPEVIEKWNEGIAEMVQQPEIIQQISNLASVVDYRNSEDFEKQVLSELEEFKSLWSEQ
jgi:tripartite-type tricarboxylate transporter receptor subunit TctC